MLQAGLLLPEGPQRDEPLRAAMCWAVLCCAGLSAGRAGVRPPYAWAGADTRAYATDVHRRGRVSRRADQLRMRRCWQCSGWQGLPGASH